MRDPRIMIVEAGLEQLPFYEYAARTAVTVFIIKQGALSALKYLYDINYDIDAVILNLALPDMNGFTLTKEIRAGEMLRAKRAPIPIFWITAHPFDSKNPSDTITELKAKYYVADIFKTSVEPVEMVKTVKAYLESHEESPVIGDIHETK